MELYDIEGIYNLLAATVRRAIIDVHSGNPSRAYDARCWLDDYYPQWRKYEGVKYGQTKAAICADAQGTDRHVFPEPAPKRCAQTGGPAQIQGVREHPPTGG